MKFFTVPCGLARSLVALAVSFALLLSTFTLAFASSTKSTAKSPAATSTAATLTNSAANELELTSVSAIAGGAGVLLEWRTNSTPDNVGFNIYRVKNGQRVRVNKELVPGALFGPGTPAMMRAGYSYAWFDRGGTLGATYFIESVTVDGAARIHQAISPVTGKTPSEFEQTSAASATDGTDVFAKQYPAAEGQLSALFGTIQDQWAIAGQLSLKIGIKKDGWYRVTQPQMVAAGFNPTVDIRNLRLFVDATEVAILTNQFSGPFGSGDYIEFYGRGLDTPTTDTRIYYLTAGTTPGKRVTGEIRLDTPPDLPPGEPEPPSTSEPPPATPPVRPPVSPPIAPVRYPDATVPVLRDPIFHSQRINLSWLMNSEEWNRIKPTVVWLDRTTATDFSSNQVTLQPDKTPVNAYDSPNEKPAAEQPSRVNESVGQKAMTASSAALVSARPSGSAARVETSAPPQTNLNQSRRLRKRAAPRKKAGRKSARKVRPERNHALVPDGFAAATFDSTTEIKTRGIYYSSLLNGDAENWFGAVIVSPVNLGLTVPNPDLTATAPASLEFALQGVFGQGNQHQVTVAFNGVNVGVVDFAPLEHPIRTFPVPIALLQSGSNMLRFTGNSTTAIVDYVRLTYPHTYKADSGKFKFSLRGNQTRTVDGFSTPSVRLIDYTDPLAVSVSTPPSTPSASGYVVTVPVSESFSKNQRLFYAIAEGQFDQPATLLLSQPSTLNSNANLASFVIISHQNFVPSFTTNVGLPLNTSLVAQRTSQGFSASVVDVEDVYDEFSYGVHGPQAIKDFLQYASTHWATPPRYVVFAGDASYDPRNYQGAGNWDLVPTKLVDDLFTEACSDDWLTDFDNDGVGDIPVGRLPFRTVADADLVIKKIVNFTPEVSQKALLVADQDEFNIYGFVETNDTFQSLLPASMTVQRVNRAPQPGGVPTQPDNQVRADIIAALNEGRALVGYSGHGNVDVWTGANLFNKDDAMALTNEDKLSFVVVMDCLNGRFEEPIVLSLSEAFLQAPHGGAVAAFASSGLTFAQGQHVMGQELYTQLYGGSSIALGDAIKLAKAATFDDNVKRTWIFFGDPSLKIR